MSAYDLVKAMHVVSAAIIFGTGLGTAFVVWRAERNGEVAAIAFATRHAVVADWMFTTVSRIAKTFSGAKNLVFGGLFLPDPDFRRQARTPFVSFFVCRFITQYKRDLLSRNSLPGTRLAILERSFSSLFSSPFILLISFLRAALFLDRSRTDSEELHMG